MTNRDDISTIGTEQFGVGAIYSSLEKWNTGLAAWTQQAEVFHTLRGEGR